MKIAKQSVFALAILFGLAGCGGGVGSTGGSTTPTQPTNPQAAVSCVAQIQVGVTSPNYVCTANEEVTWSVDDTTLATISTTGVLTPNLTKTGTLHVTATPSGGGPSTTVPVGVVNQVAYTGGSGQNIAVVNADGTGTTVILQGSCYDENFFVDHLQLVCSTITGNGLMIYKLNGLSPTLAQTLTFTSAAGALIGQPDLASPSPDGKTLVFRGYDTGTDQYGVYKANVDGSGLQALSMEKVCLGACPFGIGQPRFNHSGSMIVYTHVVYPENAPPQSWVYVMKSDGTDQQPIAQGSDGAFTVDDKNIIYTSPSGEITTIDTAGDASTAIAIEPGFSAIATPNGQSLVFSGSCGGVCISDMQGVTVHPLASIAGNGHPSI